MGLTNRVRIIEDAVTQYKERMHSPYTRFLKGTHTYSTYYSLSREESTTMMGTEDVNSYIGDDSPYEFNQIDDFVLYNLPELLINSTYDDIIGTTSDIEGEATVPPSNFIPVAGDHFFINYLGSQLIFRVSKVEPSLIDSNYFYKISFYLAETNYDISKINVADTFKMILDNIGTEYKAIIHSDFYTKIDKMIRVREKASEYYMENFYVPQLNSIIYRDDEDNRLYNIYLTKFIIDNPNIFIHTNSYSSYVFNIEDEVPRNFRKLYDNSIYGAIEKKSYDFLKYNKFLSMAIAKESSILKIYKEEYKSTVVETIEDNPIFTEEDYKYFIDTKLINALEAKDDSSLDVLHQIIYNFIMADEYIMSDEDIVFLEEYSYYDDYECYSIIPILMYIIKYTEDYLMKSKHTSN